jgi:hypothetical protein
MSALNVITSLRKYLRLQTVQKQNNEKVLFYNFPLQSAAFTAPESCLKAAVFNIFHATLLID